MRYARPTGPRRSTGGASYAHRRDEGDADRRARSAAAQLVGHPRADLHAGDYPVETDNGLEGLGEAPGGGAMAASLKAARPHIIGLDPWQLEPLRVTLRNARLYSALEEACLDLIGKSTGRPVSDLLGGTVRSKVPWAAYLFYKEEGEDEWGEVLSPESMVGLAERWVERWGFKCFKVKGGVLEPDAEVETMRLLRSGSARRWAADRPERHLVGRDLAAGSVQASGHRSGVPGRSDLGHHRHGRSRQVDPHPAQHQYVRHGVQPHPRGVPRGAISVILSDHHLWEGLTGCVKMARFCQTLGWGVGQHSNSHLGITMAAMIHLGAAVPNMLYASDTHYPWNPDDIIKGPMFKIKDGYLDVPKGPGLGVELDEDKVAKYAEAYQQQRGHARDDVPRCGSAMPTGCRSSHVGRRRAQSRPEYSRKGGILAAAKACTSGGRDPTRPAPEEACSRRLKNPSGPGSRGRSAGPNRQPRT